MFKNKKVYLFIMALLCQSLFIGMASCEKARPSTQEGKKIFDSAQSLLISRKYNEAIAEFKKLLVAEPDFEDTYLYLGEAYSGRGFFDESIYWYRESLKYNPDNAQVWQNLGKAYELKSDFLNSAKSYYACLQINPNNLEVQYALKFIKEKLAKQAPSEASARINAAPIGKDSTEVSSIYFYIKSDPKKWRLVSDEQNTDKTRVKTMFESLGLIGKDKKPILISVSLYAEKLREEGITSVKFADLIAGSQADLKYYVIYRDASFGKLNAVKDNFSLKKDGKLLKGAAVFLVKKDVAFYLSCLGPAENYEDIKSSFQEFLNNLILNF